MAFYTIEIHRPLYHGFSLNNPIPMRTTMCVLGALILSLVACTKNHQELSMMNSGPYAGYHEFRIMAGQNYCEKNSYPKYNGKSAAFNVIFDSSAIYQTAEKSNQLDINKLYGFADCGTHHQDNSARFGWRWNGSSIDILAYCYVNSTRKNKLVGTVNIGEVNKFNLSVDSNQYVFQLNKNIVRMERACAEPAFNGYELYPYFGGDEPAPHNISIFISFQP